MKARAQLNEPAPRRFTVAEFEQMGVAGIFPEGDRVELIRGEIIEMVPIGSGHSGRVARLTRAFILRLGERVHLSAQNPAVLADDTEPQPDIVLARPRVDDYTKSHPTPADILLLIEVAESSARYDRQTKAPLYAAVGIAEYWIVDLRAEVIEVHRQPGPEGYGEVVRRARGEFVAPLAFPECGLSVEEILR